MVSFPYYLNNMAELASKNTLLQDIKAALNGTEYTSFALAIVLPNGEITVLSDGIKTDPKILFTPDFRNELLIGSGRFLTQTIEIGDDTSRDNVYRKCLADIQQSARNIIGRACVNLLEPKKQSFYPYTKGAQKRPPWWPVMIRHIEPEDLCKDGMCLYFPRPYPVLRFKIGLS